MLSDFNPFCGCLKSATSWGEFGEVDSTAFRGVTYIRFLST